MSRREEELHLPDLSFIHLCEARYGVNRGIYNTIDAWFYEQGITDILSRRSIILSFLDYVQSEAKQGRNPRQKFGPGGLAIKLEAYYSTAYQKTGS